jgi:hypothetical protein
MSFLKKSLSMTKKIIFRKYFHKFSDNPAQTAKNHNKKEFKYLLLIKIVAIAENEIH